MKRNTLIAMEQAERLVMECTRPHAGGTYGMQIPPTYSLGHMKADAMIFKALTAYVDERGSDKQELQKALYLNC